MSRVIWLRPIDSESRERIAEAIAANGFAVRTPTRETRDRLDAAETALSIAEVREFLAQLADYGERSYYAGIFGIGSRV